VASLGLAVAGALMAAFGVQHSERQRLLGVGVEIVTPLVAALPVAWMIAREPAIELQLSVPRPYPGTVMRRLAIAVAWSWLLCFAIAGLLWVAGWWRQPHGFWQAQLTWLSPLMWLVAAATLVVLLRSPSAAGGLIAVLWLLEIVLSGAFLSSRPLRNLELFATTFAGPAAPFWLSNRLLLFALALLMLALAAWALGRSELLLAAAREEPT
jgi:hypothetical protein